MGAAWSEVTSMQSQGERSKVTRMPPLVAPALEVTKGRTKEMKLDTEPKEAARELGRPSAGVSIRVGGRARGGVGLDIFGAGFAGR